MEQYIEPLRSRKGAIPSVLSLVRLLPTFHRDYAGGNSVVPDSSLSQTALVVHPRLRSAHLSELLSELDIPPTPCDVCHLCMNLEIIGNNVHGNSSMMGTGRPGRPIALSSR